MARTPSGTITSVATELAPARTVTAISNAVEAVVSSTGHGYSNGDLVVIYSSWGRLNARAARVKSVTTDSFVLERFNTTNQDIFPAGGGAGTVRKAVLASMVDLDRTKAHTTSGGDAKTVVVQWTETDVETVLNNGFTAVTRTFEMDADMIGTPAYNALETLSQTQLQTIVRRRARTGSITLLPATIAFNPEEIESEGAVVVVKGTFNAQNISTRYPAP